MRSVRGAHLAATRHKEPHWVWLHNKRLLKLCRRALLIMRVYKNFRPHCGVGALLLMSLLEGTRFRVLSVATRVVMRRYHYIHNCIFLSPEDAFPDAPLLSLDQNPLERPFQHYKDVLVPWLLPSNASATMPAAAGPAHVCTMDVEKAAGQLVGQRFDHAVVILHRHVLLAPAGFNLAWP